jgi:hypothetical protein
MKIVLIQKSFSENCESWKNDLRQSLGGHYIYATCNDVQLTLNDKISILGSYDKPCNKDETVMQKTASMLLLTQ